MRTLRTYIAIFILAALLVANAGLPAGASEDTVAFTTEGLGPSFRSDLWTWSSRTGKVRRLAASYSTYGCTFSPDGKQIVFLGYPRSAKEAPPDLYGLNLKSGTVRRITRNLWGGVACEIAWRPHTNQIAVNTSSGWDDQPEMGDAGVWLVDARSGKKTLLLGPAGADYPINLNPIFNGDGSMLACLERGAVMQVAGPGKRFKLDQPKGIIPDLVLDWNWVGSSRRLLIGVTTAKRWDEKSELDVRGPGGLWVWDVGGVAAKKSEPKSRARLRFAKGESVYAVAVNREGSLAAYLSDSGLWLVNLRTRGRKILLHRSAIAAALRNLHEASKEEWCPLSDISFSPDSHYLSWVIDTGWGDLGSAIRILDIRSKGVVYSKRSDRITQAAWRPR